MVEITNKNAIQLIMEDKQNINRPDALYNRISKKVEDFFTSDENKRYQPVMETITKKTGIHPIKLINKKRELENQGKSSDDVFAEMKAKADDINFGRTVQTVPVVPVEVPINNPTKKPSFKPPTKVVTQVMQAARATPAITPEDLAKQVENRRHQSNTGQLQVKVGKPGQVQPALDQKEKTK